MNQILAFGAALSVLLFSSGCATAPPPFASDYSETPLAPMVFRLVYRGDDSLPSERKLDLLLLRACKSVRERAFSHFAIVDEEASRTGQPMYYAGLDHFVLKPRRGVVVKCFETKPDRVFSFDCGKLEKVLKEKLNI